MATIRVAEYAGACYGVQRALDLVHTAAEHATAPVHTLGPLIHNPQVVIELEHAGVTVVDTVPNEPHSVLVLRTHGVDPATEQCAHDKDLQVVDATCPYVKRVHAAAERLQRSGYQVVVIGEAGHPEVEAILGHAPGAVVIATLDDVKALTLANRVGVVVQTTQSKQLLDELVCALMAQVDEVCVINTICAATRERQHAARKLAQDSQVMIVLGGKNSANTTRLAEICAEVCPHTYHIETPSELKPEWVKDIDTIGVSAGASTPASQVECLVETLHSCTATSARP